MATPTTDPGSFRDPASRVFVDDSRVWRALSKEALADYEALASAAFLYGVRPSTMARLLVNRGARAVLESKQEGLDRRRGG